ncbi:NAD-glutamate dehydrogenase [Mariprofundus sp. NF]|uniref:NAD-glutamate dehydrogenase domain-containing protein n=1 Tax=Mariprofundus sp. NF TaxID=2608716 RepID=UPI0015A19926|nr:NAD-glutamate dehydrogenase domain-containing protein [Mariprofundus sp. NF]NWF38347.1 NAD-glutamate dehydrogenase [Mariprofundus sp. NF]
MRHLRSQLIDLLDQARQQHRMEIIPKRLLALLVKEFLALLPGEKSKRVELSARTLTHGNLHRHIFTIRCPDQAFYLDAIKGYLLKCDIQPIGQQTMVAKMECDDEACYLELRKPDIRDEANFMFIALHISATITPDIGPLKKDIQAILQAVDLSVRDYRPMQKLVAQAVAGLMMADDSDGASLLDWMNDAHFLHFGIIHENSRLGVAKKIRVLDRIAPGLLDQIKSIKPATEIGLCWFSLSATAHYLYSAASVEVVRASWRGAKGEMQQIILIGHFSRSARYANASYLPVLASRWRELASDTLLQHSAFYRREIRTLFDRMPKRILLASKGSDWLEPLKAIIDLAGPMQLVARLIPVLEGNTDILMITVTAKRFGPSVMQHMLQALADAGQIIHGHDSFGIGPHRIILIGIDRSSPAIPQKSLEESIRHCIIFWKDIARAEVMRHADIFDIPATLNELEQIPPLYQELFPPAQFTRDLQMRERVLQSGRTRVYVTPRAKATGDEVELHIYSLKQPSLGTLVDTIRAFGLDPIQEAVVPFGKDPECLENPDDRCGCIHISSLICRAPLHLDKEDAQRLRRGLAQALNDEADHDPINVLLITAKLEIDQIAVMITLRNHLIQLIPDAAKLPLSDMISRHPEVSAALHRLFAAHHLPAMPESYLVEARELFHESMGSISNLSDDRWFRALAELVEASLRSNAFIRAFGEPVGIKIDPGKLSYAPEPKPYREIFVHGVHMEGVHLRAGPIARGGLRYSDRPSDFRTEVLELMSTQVVKNGQIVPTGSKGGFVVRGGTDSSFVLDQYRTFIDTLLSLTDNMDQATAVAAEGIRIAESDANDPYLVVAADKGTARFSDDANERSQQAGFWLGDAFASGGRFGYDHKKVGITARGAWVCVAHHFAKLGIDAYSDPISCVGIGDMGGDVFGNGMLLNPQLRLIAAFNHRHIFLDPEPDATTAFAERQRLFAEMGGWDSYNQQLISQGGGLFERSAKTIPLARNMRKLLMTEEDSLSGEALIRAILAAPVDLLYNGGIGTYIKAASESHADVRDPGNNAVRIDATQLRCRAISEGGNLGLTQKARIDYALAGGIINTDAMDNAAGVDMSDHEVNLKILLSPQSGNKISFDKRNSQLKALTEAVTADCLNNNLLQSRAITLAEAAASQHPLRLRRLRDHLTEQGWLGEAVAPRMQENELLHLRPQLSVLLGQEKNRIHARLSAEMFHQLAVFNQQLLNSYFPEPLHKRFASKFSNHPLASEIIHTVASNHVVNHIGLGAVHHLESMVDHSISDIAGALLVSEALLEAQSLRDAIWSDVKDPSLVIALQQQLQEQLIHFAEELLRLCPIAKLDQAWVKKQRNGLARFRDQLLQEKIAKPEVAGLEAGWLEQLATLPELAHAACALHISSTHQIPLNRCLTASRACLQHLPIREMERQLRSADWGAADAHSLRREWLQRLVTLKEKAICQLLDKSGIHFEATAKARWHQHPSWANIEYLMRSEHIGEDSDTTQPSEPRRAESRRMQLLLALTRLESIIETQGQ